MRGDFSRRMKEHARAKSYSRLLMQQGRVLLDSDWDEQVELERQLTRIAVGDAVGHCGVPRVNPGFEVTIGDGGELEIGAGRIYVNGVLVENRDGVVLTENELVGSPVPDGATGLIYLEVRERHVTAGDDERLREKALGGPDTMTRAQTSWRIGRLPVAQLEMNADQITDAVKKRRRLDLAAWAPTTGTLAAEASTAAVDAENRPCQLPPTAGYSDQRNSLYRVEIHQGGDETTARYKWSRRNGSIRGRVRETNGVRTLDGVEANEQIASGDWVEVRTVEQQELGTPGQLAKIKVNEDRTISFDANHLPGNLILDGAVAVLWNHAAGADPDGIPLHTSMVGLESGVQVRFSEGTYAEGEYWLIPAREATGDIEWPPVAGGPEAARPISHGPWFCPLALATRGGGPADVDDLRIEFPPLTAIRADDVSYDSTSVDIDGAENVQQALERLAMRGGGHCTLHASPGLGWENVFDQVREGQDAHICLEVGQYLLRDVVRIVAKGHVELIGQGRGTHVIAPSTESALQFIRCAGVTVRNLRITAGTAPDLSRRPGRNGTLECRDCGPVVLESVWARCNGARTRSSACFSVGRYGRSASQTLGRGDVLIRDCTLVVGIQQIGINIVNTRRTRIIGNIIYPEPLKRSQVWEMITGRRALRREVADLLLAHRRPSAAEPLANEKDLTITNRWHQRTFPLDGHSVTAIVYADVGDKIETYLKEAGPAGIQQAGDLSTHLRNILMTALKTGGTIDALRRKPNAAGNRVLHFDLLRAWVRSVGRSIRSHASQGIVVGGSEASLIEIHENEVTGAIQGIHVGLSHKGQKARQRDIARRVSIVGNTVDVAVVPLARARHGIFCGNFRSLLIQHNFVSKSVDGAFLRSLPISGVYVRGYAGSFMQVKDNDIRDCATGVHFEPDQTTRSTPQWLIADNLLQSSARLVNIPVDAALRAKVRNINNRSG